MGKPKASKNTEFDPIEMIEKNAEMNRIDQTNQYGSSKYSQNPDGSYRFDTTFSPELKALHEKQIGIANKGSIKDPLAHLASQGGGGMGDLMSSMFGRMKSRYMGTEGESDSRHNNFGKGGGEPDTPPDILGDGGTVSQMGSGGMSTSTQLRELQERQKLAEQMNGSAQQSPRSDRMA